MFLSLFHNKILIGTERPPSDGRVILALIGDAPQESAAEHFWVKGP